MKRNKGDLSEANRRQYLRLKPSAVPFLKSVVFNQGLEAQVVNISRGGILLETDERLKPQTEILLKLVTTYGVIRTEGLIIRSAISSLNRIPRYKSAIAFEQPFHMLDDLPAELEKANRREYLRLKHSAAPFLKSVAFNQGFEAQVVNISRGGILLETDVRLRPQMEILLKFVTTNGVFTTEGLITRSAISSLNGVPRYKSAIAFEYRFHMLDDLSAELEEQKQVSLPEATAPSVIDATGNQLPAELIFGSPLDRDSVVLTVIAQEGIFARDMFNRNDW